MTNHQMSLMFRCAWNICVLSVSGYLCMCVSNFYVRALYPSSADLVICSVLCLNHYTTCNHTLSNSLISISHTVRTQPPSPTSLSAFHVLNLKPLHMTISKPCVQPSPEETAAWPSTLSPSSWVDRVWTAQNQRDLDFLMRPHRLSPFRLL